MMPFYREQGFTADLKQLQFMRRIQKPWATHFNVKLAG
jgi:hypothetical protein